VLHNGGDQLVVHGAVHKHTLDGSAALPRVLKGPLRNRHHRRRHVRVGAHTRRVLAAELERAADPPRRRGDGDLAPRR